MSYKCIKRRTYEILEKGSKKDKWSFRVDVFIIVLIILNVTAVILESVAWMNTSYHSFFSRFETFSIVVFTVEYLLRLWSITENEKYSSPFFGRIKYLFSFYSLVDLISFLPAYIPMFGNFDSRFIRGIRILRLFRILKLSRYNKAFNHIKFVIYNAKEELLISLFAVITLLVISSSIMFFVENELQPEMFSSIPATMWWGVATLTTVGYGDIYPITSLGKIMAGVMAILGVGLFALPAGILASGFSNSIEEKKNKKNDVTCEHCGK